MPPKVRFKTEEIIQAAYDLVDEGGWANMTALNMAARLNCSVQPLYREFKSLAEIKRQVMVKLIEVNLEYDERQYSEISIINYAISSSFFVRDHPQLNKAMIEYSEEVEDSAELWKGSHRDVFQKVRKDPYFKGISLHRLSKLYMHASVYLYGFSQMIMRGFMVHYDEKLYIAHLEEAIHLIIGVIKDDAKVFEEAEFYDDVYKDE